MKKKIRFVQRRIFLFVKLRSFSAYQVHIISRMYCNFSSRNYVAIHECLLSKIIFCAADRINKDCLFMITTQKNPSHDALEISANVNDFSLCLLSPWIWLDGVLNTDFNEELKTKINVYLNHYFRLHVCPSMCMCVTLQRFIPLIAPEAPTALVPGTTEPRIYPRSVLLSSDS